MSERKENLAWLLIIFVVLVGILPLLTWGMWGGYMPGMMGMMSTTGMMGYGWGFMSIISIAFLVLIGVGAYYLITGLAGQGRTEPVDAGKSLEILKERYARGEITREQYLKMKEDLKS